MILFKKLMNVCLLSTAINYSASVRLWKRVEQNGVTKKRQKILQEIPVTNSNVL
ncbi:hypothetical protein SAMN04487881_0708 [Marinobacter sp. es.048]|nr:hypothetical protein SAMN04487881_0708 [Marinobacter sp. es.048]